MGCRAEVVCIAVCLNGVVCRPSATRLAIHVRIRAPAHTQVETVSHHLYKEMVLRPIRGVSELKTGRPTNPKVAGGLWEGGRHAHMEPRYFYPPLARAQGRTPEAVV